MYKHILHSSARVVGLEALFADKFWFGVPQVGQRDFHTTCTAIDLTARPAMMLPR